MFRAWDLIKTLRTLAFIKSFAGLSLPDICRRARKVTIIGAVGLTSIVVFNAITAPYYHGVSDGDMSGLGTAFNLLFVMIIGLGSIVGNFLFKFIYFVMNLSKAVDLLKLFMVDIFALIFCGIMFNAPKNTENTDVIFAVGLGIYFAIAYVYYIYCGSTYKGLENEQKGKK